MQQRERGKEKLERRLAAPCPEASKQFWKILSDVPRPYYDFCSVRTTLQGLSTWSREGFIFCWGTPSTVGGGCGGDGGVPELFSCG